MDLNRKAIEDTVRNCYASWSDTYYDDYYGPKAAYPPVHRDILRRQLKGFGAANLLDAGCGSASFLRDLSDSAMDLYGFDLTSEMVDEARRVFIELGLPPERIWQGSVCDPTAFKDPTGILSQGFDAAVCSGVLPHIAEPDDARVIGHLHDAVRPGGLVMVEARNALFALFTLNRYTSDFFQQALIRSDDLAAKAAGDEADALHQALDGLKERFRMDLPEIRRGNQGEPGYDEVLSRTHNPFVLKEMFIAQGFIDVRLLFYHYHCLPPMLASHIPDFFQRQSLAMENPEDWRGYFMASAMIITGIRQ